MKEDLISLQAEVADTVLSYDPSSLASKLLTLREQREKSGNVGSIFSLGESLRDCIINYFRASSPVHLAFSQYKSSGYPWIFGYLPSSRIAILSVKYLEISPRTTTIDNISYFEIIQLNNFSDDAHFTGNNSTRSLQTPEDVQTNEWRRWPLTHIDRYPQWRLLALSSDEVAAVAYSNGVIEVINLRTSDTPRITIKKSTETEFVPIVGLYFLQHSSHLLVCRYSGSLEIWSLSNNSVGFSALLVCQKQLDFTIFSTIFDAKRELLVLGGEFIGPGNDNLTVFSVRDLTLSEISSPKSSSGCTSGSNKLKSFTLSVSAKQSKNLTDAFVSLSLSPDKNFLAALHCSRAVSIWRFPSCSLLTTIISDAVAVDNSIVSCKSLSPFLDSKAAVPLRINWWKRPQEDPLLAILKSDGSLSVIDIDTLENQLFGLEKNNCGDTIVFEPFTSFAMENMADSNQTELLLLECTLERNSSGDASRVLRSDSSQSGFFGGILTALGIWRTEVGEEKTEALVNPSASSFVKASVIRIAATSPTELCIHRLRSCRFSDAFELISSNEVDIDAESVWQYQFLALFQFPAKPTTFERLLRVCVKNIKLRKDWLLRECLHAIPNVEDSSWSIVDVFNATKLLLNEGLSRSVDAKTSTLFRERILHIDILTRIFAEECAMTLAFEEADAHSYNPTRDIRAWSLEIEVYRQNHPLSIAIWYLQNGRYTAFAILLSFYASILTPHIIPLLSTIPASESPLKFLRPILQYPPEKPDEPPPLSEFTEGRIQTALNQLTSLLPADYHWREMPPTCSNFSRWACSRSFELDRMTGVLSSSQELLQVSADIINANCYAIEYAKKPRVKRRALQQLERHLNEVNQFVSVGRQFASKWVWVFL